MAGVQEIDAENTITLKGNKNHQMSEDLALKFCRSKKKTMFLLTSLVSVVLIIVTLICVLLAVGTGGKCQTPDPKILPVSRDPCDDDWIWYKRKCYYFSPNISEWEKSQSFCASRNASLAIIDWTYELDFILRFKGSSDHWIGLKRENETQPWVWTNGSSFNDLFSIVGFSSCVLVNSGRIASASCYSDKHWICNKPAAQTTNPHF